VLEPTDRPRPKSLADLFFSFTFLALQGFGGVVVIVQRELVERKRWMTLEEFVENWAVAQILPGPNVVNIAMMIGSRYFGLRGALVAMAGMMAVPLLLLLLLTIVYGHFASLPTVAGALRGMAAVAAGLIIATGLKMLPALKKNPLGIPVSIALAGACFALVAVMGFPLIYVLFGLGPVGCLLAFWKLKP
jgi:chromate transporter